MLAPDRTAFQEEVAAQLKAVKRSTFRGDVALKLDLVTASKAPPHAHTIAKNLLDLLGNRMTSVDWPRKSLLYVDDSQIQALSVMCRHGEDRPSMRIEARSFSAMLDDLELATDAMRATETMQSYHEAVLPAQLGGLHASLVLTQHANDLILGKTASPHRSSPSDELTYQWHDFRGAGHYH